MQNFEYSTVARNKAVENVGSIYPYKVEARETEVGLRWFIVDQVGAIRFGDAGFSDADGAHACASILANNDGVKLFARAAFVEPEADVPDFRLQPGGSVWLLEPKTLAAQDWAAAHLPADCPMWGLSFAIEHRYVDAIVEGIRNDGLTI